MVHDFNKCSISLLQKFESEDSAHFSNQIYEFKSHKRENWLRIKRYFNDALTLMTFAHTFTVWANGKPFEMFSEVSTWDSWLPAELSCLLCFSFERWVLYLCWNFYFNYWAAPKSCHSRFSKPENKGENRLARTPHVAFVVVSNYSLQITFLLSRAWFSFLWEMIGGF